MIMKSRAVSCMSAIAPHLSQLTSAEKKKISEVCTLYTTEGDEDALYEMLDTEFSVPAVNTIFKKLKEEYYEQLPG